MDKTRLTEIIEKGVQVGISKVINCNGTSVLYTYALQKIKEKYIVYTDECDLDNYYADEMKDTEKVFVYDNFMQFIENFQNKYNVSFEDFNVSKGQKFFNAEMYADYVLNQKGTAGLG